MSQQIFLRKKKHRKRVDKAKGAILKTVRDSQENTWSLGSLQRQTNRQQRKTFSNEIMSIAFWKLVQEGNSVVMKNSLYIEKTLLSSSGKNI